MLVAAGAAAAQPAGGAPEQPAGRAPDPCALGLTHEKAGALVRAHLALSRCLADRSSPGDRQAAARAALRRVRGALEDGDHAPVAFSVKPPKAVLHVPPFTADAPLAAPHEIWLPPGTHRYTASAPGHDEIAGTITVGGRERILLAITLRRTRPAGTGAPSSPTSIDFGEDGPAVDEPIIAPDPRPKKHESLLPDRFRRGLDARGPRRAAPPRRHRTWPWTITGGL